MTSSEHGVRLPWTRQFLRKKCPCGSGKISYECCWKGNCRWEKDPVGVTLTKPSTYSHPRCYLGPLGNCSDKISREHFLSENILRFLCGGDIIHIKQSADLFGTKTKSSISVNALAANVLCDQHNSALSDLDTTAGRAFRGAIQLAVERVNPTGDCFHLASRMDIERWLIKVFCGLMAAGKLPGLSGKTNMQMIKPMWLRALTGQEELPAPLGLYAYVAVGKTLYPGEISLQPLLKGFGAVAGLVLSMGGIFSYALVVDEQFKGEIGGVKVEHRVKQVLKIAVSRQFNLAMAIT